MHEKLFGLKVSPRKIWPHVKTEKWCQSTHSFRRVSEELFIKITSNLCPNKYIPHNEGGASERAWPSVSLWPPVGGRLKHRAVWLFHLWWTFYHHWSGFFSVFISFTERLLILTICVRIRRLCFHYTSKCNMHSKTTLMKEKRSTVAVWSCVYMQMTMKSIKSDIISKQRNLHYTCFLRQCH